MAVAGVTTICFDNKAAGDILRYDSFFTLHKTTRVFRLTYQFSYSAISNGACISSSNAACQYHLPLLNAQDISLPERGSCAVLCIRNISHTEFPQSHYRTNNYSKPIETMTWYHDEAALPYSVYDSAVTGATRQVTSN